MGPHRVLLVEDDPSTRQHRCRAVSGVERIGPTGSGAADWKRLADERPDVLPSDLGLIDP